MMVIFSSRSEKKALSSTRRVLDAFAERIGDNTWKTIITENGLATVKQLLRQRATKDMAVACHWLRSRSRSELVWIVGNRSKFNAEGIVPVNTTQKNLQHGEWENHWGYMPQLKVLTVMAALLHDWGKTNAYFQQKLKKAAKERDPYRHEWVSCLLLAGLVKATGDCMDDTAWLNSLIHWEFDEKRIIRAIENPDCHVLGELPPLAKAIGWLILSHHRLPVLFGQDAKGYATTSKDSLDEMLASMDSRWGYRNDQKSVDARLDKKCFSKGLLKDSGILQKKVQRWAACLLQEKEKLLPMLAAKEVRLLLCYARVSMMLGDYYISSLPAQETWVGNSVLFANTGKAGELRQRLDEHLTRVAGQASRIVRRLPRFTSYMERAYDVASLKKKSLGAFAWQDRVVEKIKAFRASELSEPAQNPAWFVVNMASTGCGKTLANAKIVQAISPEGDSLRYILALGLRSLTLQTGDEYRERIGLGKAELGVLIGSAAMKELHERERALAEADEDDGYREELLDSELDFVDTYQDDFLDIFFNGSKNKAAAKNKTFLYKPVLVATIDHIMPAVETVRGGRYTLPFLRLMSSDLVIDEIDDFDTKSLNAIARLVHLAGMLGRNVVLSSATIPPDMAAGLFRSYREGYSCYEAFFQRKQGVAAVWCDEFKAKAAYVRDREMEAACYTYQSAHASFIEKRVEKLKQQIVKRKAFLVDCSELAGMTSPAEERKQQEGYFTKIKEAAIALHRENHLIDATTGKKISFGLVRLAHIRPCVALSRFLLAVEWDEDIAPRVMTYHSRQVMLLRHEQERYLDSVLKRKGDSGNRIVITEPILRQHIDQSKENNLLFIVVATPVEEIGRDHDFDWAVVEPSSYRSLIQLVGRILRHRRLTQDIVRPNVAVMQYNLRGLRSDCKLAYCRPGYETGPKYRLVSHDMKKLVDERKMAEGIDAIPRIQKPAVLDSKKGLVELEHLVMQDFQDVSLVGASTLHGWLSEYWWMTGLPQQFNRFRENSSQIRLYRLYRDGKPGFFEKTLEGEYVSADVRYGIEKFTLDAHQMERLWLKRDYLKLLQKWSEIEADPLETEESALDRTGKRFGEISILDEKEGVAMKAYYYSDQLGLFEKDT